MLNLSIEAIKFSIKARKDLKEDFGPASEEIIGPGFDVLLFDFHCAQPVTHPLKSAPAKALQGSSTVRGKKTSSTKMNIFAHTASASRKRDGGKSLLNVQLR